MRVFAFILIFSGCTSIISYFPFSFLVCSSFVPPPKNRSIQANVWDLKSLVKALPVTNCKRFSSSSHWSENSKCPSILSCSWEAFQDYSSTQTIFHPHPSIFPAVPNLPCQISIDLIKRSIFLLFSQIWANLYAVTAQWFPAFV